MQPINLDVTFSFNSKYLRIGLETSSLTHVLFRSELFNISVYLEIISDSVSGLVLLWSESRH